MTCIYSYISIYIHVDISIAISSIARINSVIVSISVSGISSVIAGISVSGTSSIIAGISVCSTSSIIRIFRAYVGSIPVIFKTTFTAVISSSSRPIARRRASRFIIITGTWSGIRLS
jgi:hypothetical protein